MSTGAPSAFPRRGDVYLVALDPVVGAETEGTRPAVVLSNDTQNQFAETVTVAPATAQPAKKAYLHEVQVPAGIGGFTKDARIKINQVRTVSKQRLRKYLGTLPAAYIQRCETALKYHFDLS